MELSINGPKLTYTLVYGLDTYNKQVNAKSSDSDHEEKSPTYSSLKVFDMDITHSHLHVINLPQQSMISQHWSCISDGKYQSSASGENSMTNRF